MPPANTGLGFLDAVPDAAILALADENDTNGDGISGRPNWINIPSYVLIRTAPIIQNGKYIGRFGKKAAVYDLLQQTANAYNQDIGITSAFETFDTYSGQAIDPEVSTQTVNDVVFYLKTLKAPVQRNQNDADVQNGRQLFLNTGCANCHTPQLATGFHPLQHYPIKLFSLTPICCCMIWDRDWMMDIRKGLPLTAEWRTPPLWGLGLSKNSQGGQYFLLHDGRANSIEEAILLHGGEAAQSKTRFQQLTGEGKSQLIKFLESL